MEIRMLHNSRKIADAIARKDLGIIQRLDAALGRGALEIAREAQQTMPKFRSETATATSAGQIGVLHWVVAFNKHYAQYTDGGSGPGGRPPLAEMLDWIRIKGITPRTPGMTRVQLAHLLRLRIVQNGVPAQPFAKPALESKRDRLTALMRAAVGEGLQQAGSA